MSLADIVSESVVRRAVEGVATAMVGAAIREAAERIGPDKIELARTIADESLKLVPVELMREVLDDAAVRRANAIADAAEAAKGLL